MASWADGISDAWKNDVDFLRLVSELSGLSAALQPDISRETMETLTKTMSVAQLNEFKRAYENKLDEAYAPVPQLYQKSDNTVFNGQFTI